MWNFHGQGTKLTIQNVEIPWRTMKILLWKFLGGGFLINEYNGFSVGVCQTDICGISMGVVKDTKKTCGNSAGGGKKKLCPQ